METQPPVTKAVVLDLDDALLDCGRAWQYALEEGVAMVSGRRIDSHGLAEEYRKRPWRDVIAVVVPEPDLREACAETCATIYGRGAQKRLLVHEGIGMALDWVRSAHIEIGAITREAHPVALKQLQSTGMDRFVTVLSPTPPGEPWDARARFCQCLEFLGRQPCEAALVSADAYDLSRIEASGACGLFAAWAGRGGGSRPALTTPAMLGPALVAQRSGG